MGRPVKKDYLNNEVFGDYTAAGVGIKCEAYIGGSNQSDVFIVRQRSAQRYLVQDKSAGTQVIARTVSGTPAAVGEMRIQGSTTGNLDADLVAIRKLTSNIAIAFDGTRYKWKVENDSSADYLVLEPMV